MGLFPNRPQDSFFSFNFFMFLNKKPLSEVAPGLLVIPIPMQALGYGIGTCSNFCHSCLLFNNVFMVWWRRGLLYLHNSRTWPRTPIFFRLISRFNNLRKNLHIQPVRPFFICDILQKMFKYNFFTLIYYG